MLCLMVPLLMGGSYTNYAPSMLGTESGPCSTPAIQGNLEMNFESSTSTVGIDSCTGDETTARTNAMGPDCTSAGNCPLTDDTSLDTPSSGGMIEDTSGGPFTESTTDFRFNTSKSAIAALLPSFVIRSAPGNTSCTFNVHESAGGVSVVCDDATSDISSGGVISLDTDYNVRLTYNATGDVCTLSMDLRSSGNWGQAGAFSLLTCDGAGSASDSVGWAATTVTAHDFVYDDIGFCEGLSLGNTKCGRESEAD